MERKLLGVIVVGFIFTGLHMNEEAAFGMNPRVWVAMESRMRALFIILSFLLFTVFWSTLLRATTTATLPKIFVAVKIEIQDSRHQEKRLKIDRKT